MLSRLEFTKTESEQIFTELSKWIIGDKSKIVRVNAMRALANISIKNSNIKTKTIALIKKQIETGIPSLMSRGKRLLNQLT